MSARRWLLLLLVVGTWATTAAGGEPASADRLAPLSFMAGCWSSTAADGATTEECWLAPAGSVMLGVHRDVGAKGETFFEHLRIEQRGDTVVYVASPGGGAPTEFTLRKVSPDGAVFTNPQHDFPKRITYRRAPSGALRVVVDDGRAKGKRRGWVWQRASAGAPWPAPRPASEATKPR